MGHALWCIVERGVLCLGASRERVTPLSCKQNGFRLGSIAGSQRTFSCPFSLEVYHECLPDAPGASQSLPWPPKAPPSEPAVVNFVRSLFSRAWGREMGQEAHSIYETPNCDMRGLCPWLVLVVSESLPQLCPPGPRVLKKVTVGQSSPTHTQFTLAVA